MKIFFIALLGTAIPASADVNSGNDFLRHCTAAVKQADGKELNSVETLGAMYCMGYLSGFTDSHSVEQMAKPRKPLYCLPEKGLENGQLARVLVEYLKKYPEHLEMSARIHIASALTQTYPCKKQKDPK